MLFYYEGNSLKSGIYEIRNRLSNKSYIGSAKEFKERWQHHSLSLKRDRHQNKHLQKSFNKCLEIENNDMFLEFHVIEVMESSSRTERLIKEEYWINQYQDNRVILYNNQLEPTKEWKVSSINPEETKIKLGFSLKGTNNPNYGKTFSKEHKEKLRNAHLGKVHSDEHKRKIGNARKGKTYEEIYGDRADEVKRKMSEAHKGIPVRPHSEEEKKRMGESNKGKHSRIYIDIQLLAPDGTIFTKIEGLQLFCENHSLSPKNMCQVLNGKRKSHKGWRLKVQ